ncbi:uncharacterized protein V1518DRAFT_424050 [Limtongia smithiae]|uniref:uncharacterized protein n=1 Tax=Limtongia smithiae TaxID=1125753 RepID=UPI0034CD03BB
MSESESALPVAETVAAVEAVTATEEAPVEKAVETVEESKPETTATEPAAPAEKPVETIEKPAEPAAPKSNIVSDASTLPPSSDAKEILKQVEFYFSDQNLPKDKFLWTTVSANDGWVPIATIASFKRMRRFQPLDAVVTALRLSEELLEVDEAGERVRRRISLKAPEPAQKKAAFLSSVYVKGFGAETPTSQFDIEKFFEGVEGVTVRQVRLRRDEAKKFKGSVFVEFASEEEADKFVALEPKPTFGEEELMIMTKKAYVAMKEAEAKDGKHAGNSRRPFDGFRDGGVSVSKKRKAENDGEEAGEDEGEDKGAERKKSGRGGRGRGGRQDGGRGRGGFRGKKRRGGRR